MVELPDEFVQGAVALFFGQGEQDVADVFGAVPLGKVEFAHGAGCFLSIVMLTAAFLPNHTRSKKRLLNGLLLVAGCLKPYSSIPAFLRQYSAAFGSVLPGSGPTSR